MDAVTVDANLLIAGKYFKIICQFGWPQQRPFHDQQLIIIILIIFCFVLFIVSNYIKPIWWVHLPVVDRPK